MFIQSLPGKFGKLITRLTKSLVPALLGGKFCQNPFGEMVLFFFGELGCFRERFFEEFCHSQSLSFGARRSNRANGLTFSRKPRESLASRSCDRHAPLVGCSVLIGGLMVTENTCKSLSDPSIERM